MVNKNQRKVRRRQHTIWDRRGLPARHISSQQAARNFRLLRYWVRQNGICVVTTAGKPAFVLISPDDARLNELINVAVAVAGARRTNPCGVFTVADEIFGTKEKSDGWMLAEIMSLGGRRPVDLLANDAGVQVVLQILHRIEHGIFA